MNKKLLVVGSNTIHTYNFILLVGSYFDEVLLLTNQKNDNYKVNSIVLDFSLGLSSFSTVQKIKKIVYEYKPTTVHVHQANSYVFLTVLALKIFSCQKVLTAWGSDVLINPKKSILLKEMLKYSLTRVDILTADSDSVLNEANKLVSKDLELHNINFGVEVATCQGNKENIIYSNRLHKALYNIDKVIISFSKFVVLNSDWKLIIAGRGEETDKLKALVSELNLNTHVTFVGWLDAQSNYDYYCKSKIYVSVPQSDSVSLSLVEGILCGCIPFVSNLAANKELITEELGFIVNALEAIPFDKYVEIESEAFNVQKEYVKKYFSKAFNRDKYLELYEKNDER